MLVMILHFWPVRSFGDRRLQFHHNIHSALNLEYVSSFVSVFLSVIFSPRLSHCTELVMAQFLSIVCFKKPQINLSQGEV